MLKENVYEAIKQRIIICHYGPGVVLNERALLDEYNIGKMPLREILIGLQHEGLIRRYARIGTVVAPIDVKKLRNMAEIRYHLEGVVGRLAARRISDSILAQMRGCLKRMEESAKENMFESYAVEESSLHNWLYTATGNEELKQVIYRTIDHFTRAWFSVERTPLDFSTQLNHWLNIYQALCDKDEEKAAVYNVEHFEAFNDYLKSMK